MSTDRVSTLGRVSGRVSIGCLPVSDSVDIYRPTPYIGRVSIGCRSVEYSTDRHPIDTYRPLSIGCRSVEYWPSVDRVYRSDTQPTVLYRVSILGVGRYRVLGQYCTDRQGIDSRPSIGRVSIGSTGIDSIGRYSTDTVYIGRVSIGCRSVDIYRRVSIGCRSTDTLSTLGRIYRRVSIGRMSVDIGRPETPCRHSANTRYDRHPTEYSADTLPTDTLSTLGRYSTDRHPINTRPILYR